MNVLCPKCQKEIDADVNFCPYCGSNLNPKRKILTSIQKIKIYLGSFFLSPFGLIWFFKYFRDEEPENKKTAYVSLVITLVSLVFILITLSKYINSLSSIMEMYNTDLGTYSNLGL